MIPLDHKPLCTFRTRWGKVDGSRFHSEASGFDGRHVRPCDTDQFVGCGLVAPLLQPFVLGQKAVDIPELAALVAEAGLHVLFVGEYTCAQSRHCLRRALADRKPSRRMLCDRPWKTLPKPKRGWKRRADQVYSLQEFREEASPKVRKKHAPERWPFKAMHAASNWLRAVPQGRAGVSDFGHTMWPAAAVSRKRAGSRQQRAGSRQQAAVSRQQAAVSRQQAAASKRQAAGSSQQAASSRQQSAGSRLL